MDYRHQTALEQRFIGSIYRTPNAMYGEGKVQCITITITTDSIRRSL